MPRRHSASPDIWDEPLLFSIIAAAAFLLFRLQFFWSVLIPRGDCLYTFWHPESGTLLSPFWVTVVIPACLLGWAISGLVRAITARKMQKALAGFYVFAAITAGGWLHGMSGLWDTMRYERGEITAEAYFGEMRYWRRYEQYHGLHECEASE